jgi:hypothetical protein
MSDGRVLKGVVGYSPGFEVAAAVRWLVTSSSIAKKKHALGLQGLGFTNAMQVRENYTPAAISLQTIFSTHSLLTGGTVVFSKCLNAFN